jgi:ribosome-associated protein
MSVQTVERGRASADRLIICGCGASISDQTVVAGGAWHAGGMPGEELRVTRSLSIPLAELDWRFSAAGGPGGQHANTANTRAEVMFDVAASPSLGPRQRARLLDRLGPVVRVVASSRRSQAQNRAAALDRLAERLAAALAVETPRVATRPSAGADRRRLDAKRRQAARKLERRRPVPDD